MKISKKILFAMLMLSSTSSLIFGMETPMETPYASLYPLHNAVITGDKARVDSLIAESNFSDQKQRESFVMQRDNFTCSTLFYAVTNRNLNSKIIGELLDAIKDPVNKFKFILDQANNPNQCNYTLDQANNPNLCNYTTLYYVAKRGSTDLIEKLLNAITDLPQRLMLLTAQDRNHLTALDCAGIHGQLGAIDALRTYYKIFQIPQPILTEDEEKMLKLLPDSERPKFAFTMSANKRAYLIFYFSEIKQTLNSEQKSDLIRSIESSELDPQDAYNFIYTLQTVAV